ncbi:MAG: hypothetical protein DMF55_10435 [Acidobacteria bacterium]|nr:MAG: hypothetical protein DMF55_10435 [Acidobacteriota bacterium]
MLPTAIPAATQTGSPAVALATNAPRKTPGAARGPRRRRAGGLQRERQTELRRAHVEDRDAEPDEKIGAANLPEGTARRGHDCD